MTLKTLQFRANQLGRRNLTPEQMSLLRGRRYNRRKKQHGGDRRSSDSSCQNGVLKNADKLANEHGVSAHTIVRDGLYAAAVDKLGVQHEAAAGQLPATRHDVVQAAKVLGDTPTPEQVEQARQTVTKPHVAGVGTPQFRRWRASLHEAGHLVAACHLLDDKTASAVVLDAGGLAYIDVADPLRTFDQAVAVAAGQAAASLAGNHAPPTERPEPVPLVLPHLPANESDYAAIAADLRAGEPDAERVARWCTRGCPADPGRWARRYTWVHYTADCLVRDYVAEIIEHARRLFLTGRTTLSQEISQ